MNTNDNDDDADEKYYYHLNHDDDDQVPRFFKISVCSRIHQKIYLGVIYWAYNAFQQWIRMMTNVADAASRWMCFAGALSGLPLGCPSSVLARHWQWSSGEQCVIIGGRPTPRLGGGIKEDQVSSEQQQRQQKLKRRQ